MTFFRFSTNNTKHDTLAIVFDPFKYFEPIKAGLASCFCKILHLLYNFDFNTINVDNEKLNLFVSSFGQLLSRILRSFTGSFICNHYRQSIT